MGLINRFILFLYTIAVGVLSVGAALLLLQVIPERVILNELHYVENTLQLQGVGVLAVVLLLSLHLLLCCFSSKGDNKPKVNRESVLLLQGQQGEVKLTIRAVEEMVERIIASVAGVRGVKLTCLAKELPEGKGNSLVIKAVLTIGQERNASLLCDIIQTNVRQHLLQVAGIENPEIEITVDSIAGGVESKRRQLK